MFPPLLQLFFVFSPFLPIALTVKALYTAGTHVFVFMDTTMTTPTDSIAPVPVSSDDVAQSVETDFSLNDDGTVSLKGEKIAVLQKQNDVLAPSATLLTENADEKTLETVNRWVAFHLNKTLAPLFAARAALTDETMTENARAILTQTLDRFGIIRRERLKEYLKVLTEDDKKALAKTGVRLGYNFLFFPMLLKPAAQKTLAVLWKVANEKTDIADGIAADGKMSFEVNPDVPKALYFVQGYIWAGKRAIRVDVMERFTSKLREVTRQDKETPQPLPLDLLSTAGLKRDEAADVFGFLGFDVIKETTGENDDVKETLFIRMKPKKPPFRPKKQAPAKKRENAKKRVAPPREKEVDLSDSPFACLAVLKKKQ